MRTRASTPRFLPPPRSARGVALLVTLCAVVLLTILVLAFFSNSLLNRQISYSNTNVLKADQLARASLEIVTGELREEIADTAYSQSANGGNASYPVFYRPSTPADAVPKKVGIVGTSTTNLVKVSTPGGALDPSPSGRKLGSAVSIGTASRNGRLISAARWFGSGGPGLGANDVLPTWAYVTRHGVQTPSLAEAANPAAAGYVLGRFAYTVYDTGGLPDANVAGYPAAAAAAAPFKSSAAFADIGTALGIANLAAWRNGATGGDANTFSEWAAGLPRTTGTTNTVALAASASGHLATVAGDNVFFSRHDLLLAAQNSVAKLTPAQAGALTHFSRSFNGPSWTPAVVAGANVDLNAARFPQAKTVTHYDDTGFASTYPVLPGDPLLQRRFSLAKVGWITASGARAGISAAAIQACFGLVWNPTLFRWDYAGASGTALQQVETLAQAAAENREPNFFELLKAGLVDGSIGKASTNTTLAQIDQRNWEANKDLQAFQIGANIIDCAGPDNFPTPIAFTGSLPATGAATLVVHGVKDLPYLYGVISSYFSNRSYDTATTERIDYLHLVLVPELLNPHVGAIAATSGPANIRIRIASGTLTSATSGSAVGGPLSHTGLLLDLSVRPPIVIPAASFENYRSAMKPVRNGEAGVATTLSTLLGSGLVSSAYSDINAFLFYTYTGLPAVYPTIGWIPRTVFNNLLLVMEYQDASGNWIVYDTLAGNDALRTAAGGTGLGGTADFSPSMTSAAAGPAVVRNDLLNSSGWFKIDPRTTRFGGLNSNRVSPLVVSPISGGGASPATPFNGLTSYPPFGTGAQIAGANMFPGAWLLGVKTGWTAAAYAANVADPDGTVRPADGWLGAAANFFAGIATTTAATGRPLILHRPYRAVGELGYVFRGSPWKTLSFFDDTSGDGALLDLFSVSDEPPVVAGRVALNSAQSAVQQSLLGGAALSYDGTLPLTTAQGAAIATAYHAYAFGSAASLSAGTAMPVNPSQLPLFMSSPALTAAYPPATTPIKYQREAVARALASGTQTRTWNLLVDVVAQVGRFPTGTAPSSLADFVVEGEKRYWLSIAIDRYTGKVLDQQLEPVNE
ncbi:hypothetical protein SAMN05444156_0835 [Verrucomicrobium sp. GAS474]|uniref:hypothetical protein n=1 Tax=Verrucomicrobium sp. GAS474 TaxID=1882831 RepID=UPI00087B7AAE|nr:hypothetical protein [Verrucomicrobium sp. GAS474]SDT93005.1 hypothetical protein SAMN05444156_0835 [Verrucomicrobium sp. GAS474]